MTHGEEFCPSCEGNGQREYGGERVVETRKENGMLTVADDNELSSNLCLEAK